MNFLEKLSEKKEYVTFVFSRTIILLAKPLFLWVLLFYSFDFAAKTISLYYLVLGSLMVVLSNEAHFEFYKDRFSGFKTSNSIIKKEILYYNFIVIHFVICAIPILVSCYLYTRSAILAIIFFGLLISEKIFDEIQRFLQYEKKFSYWSKIMLLKSIAPILLCFFFIQNERLVTVVFFLASYSINLVLLYSILKKSQVKLIINSIRKVNLSNILQYSKEFKRTLGLNQLQSILTHNILLFDRLLVNFYDSASLPQLSVICQGSLSSVLFIDYFLISHRRNQYLIKNIKVFEIIPILKILSFAIMGFIISFLVLTIMEVSGYKNGLNLALPNMFKISIYYVFYGITMHFEQFNFWNKKRSYTIFVNIIPVIITLFLFMLINSPISITEIINTTLLMHSIRLLFQLLLAIK